ncbi:MAG: hypothetical protein QOH37_932 [Nocardioidaceae bacterium]|nr:hypothetical protein [Nocardioidaceae bacterium]
MGPKVLQDAVDRPDLTGSPAGRVARGFTGCMSALTADQDPLGSWLHHELHWLLLAALLVTLAALSAVVSMLAWADTRRHQDIRSLNRRTLH